MARLCHPGDLAESGVHGLNFIIYCRVIGRLRQAGSGHLLNMRRQAACRLPGECYACSMP